MIGRMMELELPLGDEPSGELAGRRMEHLSQLVSGDTGTLIRLTRAFPSLAAVYAASEAELAQAVGPVAAARMRWFLDAPLTYRDPARSPVIARAA
jgi:hypothetical protein